ncbi:yl-1 protein transcription factor-like 1 [Anaeramoeba flamelloides]|uniref:Yl-1 protein transcription factor-like 1 n=1 Tax=Anaeramoeba flamelloides TaxID=1746091 RepID=A0ABQ8YZ02_9EUKA|nr:yl-1 protein transcription factor-like 1 [Anaeramoeba flamelloides]
MFCINTEKTIDSLKYCIKLDITKVKKTSFGSENKSERPSEIDPIKESVKWMRNLLQEETLTIEEAFSSDCIQLLNVLNIVKPSRINTIIQTDSPSIQKDHNFQEYLRSFGGTNHSADKNSISLTQFLFGDQETLKQISLSILFLKKQYQLKGTIRDQSLRKRFFYLLTKKNLHNSPNKYKNNNKFKETLTGLNPYLNTQETLDSFLKYKIIECKNLFYNTNDYILKFINKRDQELKKCLQFKKNENGRQIEHESPQSNKKDDEFDYFNSSDDKEQNWEKLKSNQKNKSQMQEEEQSDEQTKKLRINIEQWIDKLKEREIEKHQEDINTKKKIHRNKKKKEIKKKTKTKTTKKKIQENIKNNKKKEKKKVKKKKNNSKTKKEKQKI